MNIAFDGSSLLIAPLTGVGNYVQQLLTHLLAEDRDNAYTLLAHRGSEFTLGLSASPNARLARRYFPNRLIWTQVILPVALNSLDVDIAHFPNFVAPLATRVPFVVTIHDLALISSPHLFTLRQRAFMRPLIKPTIRRARAVLTVSEASKRDLVEQFGLDSASVHVTYEAAAPVFHRVPDDGESERRLSPYGWDPTARHLLYVGTLEPRKNLVRLLHALRQLHQRSYRAHLWLVGQRGLGAESIVRAIHELDLSAFVHITDFVPLADLRAFYHLCDAFVLPSLYEGFGLPVLEALAGGVPSAVSRIPALAEILGDAGLLFDPLSVESIADALLRILTDPQYAGELSRRARLRASAFSWEETARKTLAVYESVAA